jgi:hypothetical protein
MVKQTVEHGGDRGTVAEQVCPSLPQADDSVAMLQERVLRN